MQLNKYIIYLQNTHIYLQHIYKNENPKERKKKILNHSRFFFFFINPNRCIFMHTNSIRYFLLAPSNHGYFLDLTLSNLPISSTFSSVKPILSNPFSKHILRNGSISNPM